MANIRAFQACDESSILSARTKEKSCSVATALFFAYHILNRLVLLQEWICNPRRVFNLATKLPCLRIGNHQVFVW